MKKATSPLPDSPHAKKAQGKRIESEGEAQHLIEMQRAILDAVEAHIALLDDKGEILLVNEAWRLFADRNSLQDPNYGVGQNYINLCSGVEGSCSDQAREIAAGIHRVLRKEINEFSLQYPCHSPTEQKWYQAMVFPVRNSALRGAVVMHTNVTATVRAEDTARSTESKYHMTAEQLTKQMRNNQRVLDFSLDVICSIDAEGRFLQINSACETLWGYKPAELIGQEFINYVLPEDRDRTHSRAVEVIAGKLLRDFENRYVRKDGTIAHMVWSVNWSEVDQIMFCVARDVTERKASEEKLAEQASLLDVARDAILLRDLDSTVRFWNKGAERLYGWTSEETTGRRTSDFLYPNLEKFEEATRLALEKGEWRGELDQATKAGGRLIVESRWTLLRDAEGQPKSFLVLNSDITERKKIEAQLLRSQRIDSIGTLAGGIAHDLNNMLAPILLGAALLKGHEGNDDMRQLIEDIETSARRGADLVKQVLSFARGDEGIRVSVRLGDVVKEVVSIIRKTFTKNISLKIDIAADLWLLASDPTQLNQILLNLCVNARDAMPDGGTLSISARNLDVDEQYSQMSPGIEVGRYVHIKVADTGCGIPAEHLARIFDPFFTTKELGKGTGLGLATSVGIVRSQGGVMNVYSEPGKGTTFTILLPAQDAMDKPSPTEEGTEDLPQGNGEWILLVDDEASILKITGKTLRAFGYQVLTAGDGAKAVALFAQRKKDIALILTDMMMPVMDGPATIRAVLRISPTVKIIGASGLDSAGGIGKARQAGVKHFLSKPYSASALLTMVQLCLSEQPTVKA